MLAKGLYYANLKKSLTNIKFQGKNHEQKIIASISYSDSTSFQRMRAGSMQCSGHSRLRSTDSTYNRTGAENFMAWQSRIRQRP